MKVATNKYINKRGDFIYSDGICQECSGKCFLRVSVMPKGGIISSEAIYYCKLCGVNYNLNYRF